MKPKLFQLLYFLFIFFSIISCTNHGGLDIKDYKNIKGCVIGKENCNNDETKDYWLISFTYGASNPKVGDTLIVNGI